MTTAAARRPRLLIVITLAEVGGAQTCVAQLLPNLVRHFEVTVAAHGPGPLREAVSNVGARSIELRNVRRRLGPRDFLGFLELVRLMLRERPDIVHAHSSKAGVLARLAATLSRVPVVLFTAHGWAFKAEEGLRSRLYLYADRVVARLTTTVVCVSETERREGLAARTCRRDSTVVIRNGVDTGLFAARAHVSVDRPLLVSIGRLKEPKDFRTLLRAFALLQDVPFDAKIVGDGPDRALLETEIDRLGLRGTVELTGERNDVPAILASADCFVLASNSEGLPLSILEAMAAGLPVVASAVGGVHELVTNNVTGFLVPPREPEALAARLAAVLRDPDLRERLGAAARADVSARFSIARVQEEHLALYRRMLAVVGT
jgi:glycosyltransferase involved in cell wall biosynthesis